MHMAMRRILLGPSQAIAKRKPLSGGPANWLAIVRTPANRALALGRFSGGATAGRTVFGRC